MGLIGELQTTKQRRFKPPFPHALRRSLTLSLTRRQQGLDLVFGGVLDHFLARETALARPDMPLLDRFFRA